MNAALPDASGSVACDCDCDCDCAGLADLAVVPFGLSPPTRTWTRLARRGPPWWWLSLDVCTACGQHWLVAQEERMNDVYVLRRIDRDAADDALSGGIWPGEFDAYETLLRLGPAHRQSFTFAEADSALPIAIDLVGQRPSITVAEIAELVHLAPPDADRITETARVEVATHGYPYPWKPR